MTPEAEAAVRELRKIRAERAGIARRCAYCKYYEMPSVDELWGYCRHLDWSGGMPDAPVCASFRWRAI